MASSACSSPLSTSHVLLPSSSSRRHPVVKIATAASSPFRPLMSSTPTPPARIGWSSGGGGRSAAGARDLRVAAVVRKYKGTWMREKRLERMIEQKVAEAKEACEGDARSDGCKVAWDEVEEVSQAKADLRRRLAQGGRDPLESFCQENPQTDECGVVYDDS